ncbi:YeaH/YhbH family protein [Psychrobium sp. nBUS_13]|uniref:YeaH/YhbH family protein n=1 Tax=Psychrobium sp. nBUS_13 TaxID=3395319 RepID=UPI003EBBB39E
MSHFIDRRLNAKNKSSVNRQRFLNRHKEQIKRSIDHVITDRSVTDVSSGENITIPKRDLSEPIFHHANDGERQRVHPGNDQFQQGDKIERPKQSGSQGAGEGSASDQGEGEDEFTFEISHDEYLDLLFEDLALPNLETKQNSDAQEFKTTRHGFSEVGLPNNINIVRSLKKSISRRIALTGSTKRELTALEEQLATLEQSSGENYQARKSLEAQIQHCKERINRVPFIDDFDLQFNHYARTPVPSSKAVMFCIMDVSGSMDQETKDIAKRFYILLYLFLSRTYQTTEVVYIRHHTQAKEVDEHEFFYSQETGGTVVSSALRLMHKIQQQRYPTSQWNVYAAQASDGDNWNDDTPLCKEVIERDLLPNTRYFSYIEITKSSHQSMWHCYQKISELYPEFAIKHIKERADIYPIFRELFATS